MQSQSVEDLFVYKKAREFSGMVADIIKLLPEHEDLRLKGQMRNAKLALTNGIAEGFGRSVSMENILSCRKARGALFILIDDLNECSAEGYIELDTIERYKAEAYELLKALNAYILSIKSGSFQKTLGELK